MFPAFTVVYKEPTEVTCSIHYSIQSLQTKDPYELTGALATSAMIWFINNIQGLLLTTPIITDNNSVIYHINISRIHFSLIVGYSNLASSC